MELPSFWDFEPQAQAQTTISDQMKLIVPSAQTWE